jgi:hypothetical protein
LYKRAQILAADLYTALKEYNESIVLKHPSALTMFADYRVPQILLELGIFEYDHKLIDKIMNKEELLPHSIEEIEIRVNTIIAVEKIKDEFKKKYKKDVLSLEIDYLLWNEGERLRSTMKPHHRVLTIFY